MVFISAIQVAVLLNPKLIITRYGLKLTNLIRNLHENIYKLLSIHRKCKVRYHFIWSNDHWTYEMSAWINRKWLKFRKTYRFILLHDISVTDGWRGGGRDFLLLNGVLVGCSFHLKSKSCKLCLQTYIWVII